jgi:hypothetical protein
MRKYMKISYRTHPIFQKFDTGKLGVIGVYKEDEASFKKLQPLIKETWEKYCLHFKTGVRMFSLPFYEAYRSANAKLMTIEILSETESCSGSFFIDKTTYCFYLKNFTGPDEMDFVLFEFYDGILTTFIEAVNGEDIFITRKALPEKFNGLEVRNTAYGRAGKVFGLINFLKYADVEVKHLPAGQKVQDINCKYVNDTGIKVDIIDSKWFTTLVKSDAFKVRGHFRLQACGEGLKERKLIWINDFQKDGYTAPARKLKSEL